MRGTGHTAVADMVALWPALGEPPNRESPPPPPPAPCAQPVLRTLAGPAPAVIGLLSGLVHDPWRLQEDQQSVLRSPMAPKERRPPDSASPP